MKTITLEEALKRATKGPLVVPKEEKLRIEGPGNYWVAYTGSSVTASDENEMNAALLAHCYNVLPGVVAALTEYVSFDKCICDELNGVTCQCCLASAILTKATTITLP